MRRWIAALALVPAVAWGQAPQDCYAPDADARFSGIVMNLLEIKELGATEREMTQAALSMEAGPEQAIYLEAVQHLYGLGDLPISTIVRAMKAACYQHLSAGR